MAGPMDLVGPGVATDYRATGPIAGVLAAQQMQDAQDAQGRSFRDSDLAYQLKQHEYEQALADDPVRAIDRLNKLSAGQEEQGAWQSGQMAQVKNATREAEIQKQLTSKTSDELKAAEAKAVRMLDITGDLADETNPVAFANNKKMWEETIYPALKAQGLDKKFPQEYNQQLTPGLVKQAREAAIQTQSYIQKYRLTELENKGKLDVAKETGRAHIEATRINANAVLGAAAKEGSQSADQQITTQIQKLAGDTGYITEGEKKQLIQLRMDAHKTADEFIKDKPTLRTQWASTEGDKTAREHLAKAAGIDPKDGENDYADAIVKKRAFSKAKEEVERTLEGIDVRPGPSRVRVNTPTSAVGTIKGTPSVGGGSSPAPSGQPQVRINPQTGKKQIWVPKGSTPAQAAATAGDPRRGTGGGQAPWNPASQWPGEGVAPPGPQIGNPNMPGNWQEVGAP